MAVDNTRTSHDLANELEDMAKVLRALPELPLSQLGQTFAKLKSSKPVCEKRDDGLVREQLEDLANKLPTLDKSEASSKLKPLTVESIRHLATMLGFRMPSKLNKSQAIDMLLEQVFDIPAGQELIRTFHRRKATS